MNHKIQKPVYEGFISDATEMVQKWEFSVTDCSSLMPFGKKSYPNLQLDASTKILNNPKPWDRIP